MLRDSQTKSSLKFRPRSRIGVRTTISDRIGKSAPSTPTPKNKTHLVASSYWIRWDARSTKSGISP